MKLSLILLLAILLAACNMPDATATPAATDTRTATQSSTPAPSPTITPDVVNLTYFPEWRCIWYANEPIELRRLPESKHPVVMTLERDGAVHLTGYAAREHVADDTFVQVDRVNGLAVDPPLWIIKTRVDVVNGVDREVLFPDVFDCNLPATPTEEAPQASATPAPQIWSLLQNILPTGEPLTDLRVRQPENGVCVPGGTIVGRLAFDTNNEANNRFTLSAESWDHSGTVYHVILSGLYTGKCVAVQTSTLTFMARVG